MKKAFNSTKNFVRRNKRTLIVGATLTTVILLQNSGIKSLNKFLTEKNLFDEYYGLGEYYDQN